MTQLDAMTQLGPRQQLRPDTRDAAMLRIPPPSDSHHTEAGNKPSRCVGEGGANLPGDAEEGRKVHHSSLEAAISSLGFERMI